MDKISITIVAYHNHSNIKKAIQTIEEFTDKKLKKHIYIVDNSSADNAVIDEFKDFIDNYDDIEYIDSRVNLGFGKGHNYIINKLDSEYHAIVNPDILLKEDSFSRLIAYMDSDKTVGMCIPKLVDEQGNMQLAYRENPTVFDMFVRFFCKGMFPERVKAHTLQNKDYTKPFQVPFAQGSFLVIKTDLFKELRGFDDRYFMYMEDADLCRRVNQNSRLMYCPYTEVVHKWEQGSHRNSKLFIEHFKSMIRYFLKWGFSLC